MKLNFGKRLVLFVHWLIAIVLLVFIAFPSLMERLNGYCVSLIGANGTRIAFLAFAVVYLLLSLAVLMLIFRREGRRAERGFITVDSAETGRVRIAVGAIEQMVKQAVGAVDGITDLRISISSVDDAIAINVNVALVNGSHVPTVTLNMQRAIRQFVEMNCGVSVRSVSISIQSVVNPGEGSGKRARRLEARAPVAPQPAPQPAPEWQPEPPAQPAAFSTSQPAYEEPVAEPAEAAPAFAQDCGAAQNADSFPMPGDPVVQPAEADPALTAEVPAAPEDASEPWTADAEKIEKN